jgi:hypothetical protein
MTISHNTGSTDFLIFWVYNVWACFRPWSDREVRPQGYYTNLLLFESLLVFPDPSDIPDQVICFLLIITALYLTNNLRANNVRVITVWCHHMGEANML